MIQKIKPFLWFDGNAEEAANHYVSIFKNSSIAEIVPNPEGGVLVVNFILEGMKFIGLNAGPMYKFNEAISFFVDCEDQAEVDYFWTRLTDGGTEIQCGWLKDKFGLCWQIVPRRFMELMEQGTPAQCGAVMGAMMQMVKFDVVALETAFATAEG